MIIRNVAESDLDTILKINNHEAKWVGGEATREEIASYVNKGKFLVSEQDEILTGFIIALRESADYSSKYFQWFKERVPEFVYIDRVVIAENAMRKGIGTALYRSIEGFRGKLPLVCEVTISPECNAGSVLFHEKLGFKEMDVFSARGDKFCRMYKKD